jgi:DNA-binding NtrC family response regulator
VISLATKRSKDIDAYAVVAGGFADALLLRLREEFTTLHIGMRVAHSPSAFARAVTAGNAPTLIVLGRGRDADALDWPAPAEGDLAGAPRIFIDAPGTKERAVRALRLGFVDYLEWPTEEAAILRALGQRSITALPPVAFVAQPCPILHLSPRMAALISDARRIATADCGVLITGETGTGKEIFAEFLHGESARHAAPLVKLNCAALPEHMVEAELFGHERGAFTGAIASFPGRLQLADRGTLLLDEVGDLALAAQAKLLRALEAREVTPIGGRHTRRVDLRVIAATHQPLEQLIAERRFRADLFYRLNVARLAIPPLRERAEDTALLFRHFLRLASVAWRRPLPGIEPAVLAALLEHDWPGNVRELRNTAEATLIACGEAPRIALEHLPESLRGALRATAGAAAAPERLRILAALAATRWNKTDAAKRLQCSRMTLYRRMRAYGLPASE